MFIWIYLLYAAFFSISEKERNQWGHWVKVKENATRSLMKRKLGRLDNNLI